MIFLVFASIALAFVKIPIVDICKLIVFFIFFVWLPGKVIIAKFNIQFPGFGILVGIILNIVAFSISLLVRQPELYSVLYPLLTIALVTFVRKSPCFVLKKFNFELKDFLVCSLVLTYTVLLLKNINHIPFEEFQGPRIWTDTAFFAGLIAAMKINFLVPDYHISGEILRYHYLSYQTLASAAVITNISAFNLVAKVGPIFGIFLLARLLISLEYAWFKDRFPVPIFPIFGIFMGSIGREYAGFLNGFGTTLNLYSSPSILFSFCFLVGTILTFEIRNSFKILLFCSFAFATAGSKISTGLAMIAGVLGLFTLGLSSKEVRQKLGAPALALTVGFLLSYFWFQYGGETGAGTKLSFPNPLFISLKNIFPFHIDSSGVGMLFWMPLAFLLRFAPAVWAICVTLKYFDLKRREFVPLLIAAAGIFASFIIDSHFNEIHFFHAGIFCVFILVANTIYLYWNQKRKKSMLALLLISLLSIVPTFGDPFIPAFQGFKSDGSLSIKSIDLSEHHVLVYQRLKSISSPLDVVLTCEDRLISFDGTPSYNFYASAISERQQFIEGWKFSRFIDRSADEQDLVYEKLKLRNDFFNSTDAEQANDILKKINVQWVVWDGNACRPLPTWAREHFKIEFESGLIALLKTTSF